ncbi:hypothetical protein G7Z17_g2654 [Cylindrodendrum hubeiense]|uniref:Isochorismatase-like domain-containing protein n=1 Tax=Cylindrodendrum hubeiense TaxID=595255 RepID=A0A9P5LK40_9HYPO|nr:hypothetical protein G7Z17_g2654 [Cylindrodendrum hubeiense]
MSDPADAPKTADPTTAGYYGPSKTALLLLDFHSMFVEKIGGPDALAALSVAGQMRTWAKSQCITVVHALIDIDAATFPTCKGAERLSSIIGAMKSGGAEEPAELLQDLSEDEPTFTRVLGHVSALKSPGILEFLHGKGIKSLILTGLSTSGCVLRTAIPATDAEFVVSVISDACADRERDVHNMVIEKLIPSRGYVATAAEFQEEYIKARNSD